MSEVSFADLGLSEPLLRALHGAKYTHPTPIQARTIPALLQGRDVLGIAQTGTGKTAAFALPVLQLLAASGERALPKSPRALVLAPTRELAVQIARSFDTYGRGLGLRLCTVVGGLGYGRQIETLAPARSPITSGENRKPSPQVSGKVWRACITAATICTWVAAPGMAAGFSPISTGKERTFIKRSPSIALKSLRVMMPWAPKLNNKAKIIVPSDGIAPPNMTAAPVTQAKPS